MNDIFQTLGLEGKVASEEAMAHLIAAWASGEGIPRVVDKTVTPMAGARVDLESCPFIGENSGK